MQERLGHILFNEGKVKKTDRILCAVSGGADSIVMTYLMSQLGVDIVVAHCNFQLRGNESDEDEAFVADFCDKHGIPFVTKSFDTIGYSRVHKNSIQEAARDLRYAWFNQVSEIENCHWICTAHNLSDNAETMLINQLRGTGIKGLTGIPFKRESLLRPMLEFSSSEIRAYANDNKLAYRVDSSNHSDAYLRNSLRHRVTPELLQIASGFESTFLANANRIKESVTLLDAFVLDFKHRHVKRDGKTVFIPKKKLYSYPHPHIIVSKLLRNGNFEMGRIKQLLASNDVGKRIESVSHTLHSERDYFILKPISDEKIPTLDIRATGHFEFENWTISVVKRVLNDVKFPLSKSEIVIQSDVLAQSIQVRSWHQSDRIRPFGMKGNKLISDVLTDNKISSALKPEIPIFTIDDTIFWVGGLCFSELFKLNLNATDQSTEVVHITLSKKN